jgi:hypothetical protein
VEVIWERCAGLAIGKDEVVVGRASGDLARPPCPSRTCPGDRAAGTSPGPFENQRPSRRVLVPPGSGLPWPSSRVICVVVVLAGRTATA